MLINKYKKAMTGARPPGKKDKKNSVGGNASRSLSAIFLFRIREKTVD
jgi:hypothetical protein